MKEKNIFYGKGLIIFLLAVFRVVFFLSCFAIGIGAITALLGLFTDLGFSSSEFPVLFSMTNEGVFQSIVGETESHFKIHNAMGYISLENPPKIMVYFSKIVWLIAATGLLISIRQTILILEAINEGRFLIIKNFIRLRWIALIGIVLFVLDYGNRLFSYSYFSEKLSLTGVDFEKFNAFGLLNVEFVFYSLFLLVLAEAFRVGAQLKEETELTI